MTDNINVNVKRRLTRKQKIMCLLLFLGVTFISVYYLWLTRTINFYKTIYSTDSMEIKRNVHSVGSPRIATWKYIFMISKDSQDTFSKNVDYAIGHVIEPASFKEQYYEELFNFFLKNMKSTEYSKYLIGWFNTGILLENIDANTVGIRISYGGMD